MKENETLKQIVLKALEEGIREFFASFPDSDRNSFKIKIEYSRDEKFGDYSTSFALENSKILKKNPLQVAQELSDVLRKREDLFETVDFTPPGFVNFRVSSSFLLSFIESSILSEDYFPQVDKPLKINLEFVSANPTGPLNIVSARAAATGDAMASLLRAIGHKVDKEFYINDYGNQVFLLGVSTLVRIRELKGESYSQQESDDSTPIEVLLEKNVLPAEGYRGEYIKDIANTLLNDPVRSAEIVSLLNEKKYRKLAELCSAWTVESNLIWQRKDLDSFGVEFDNYFSERTLHEADKVLSVMNDLEKSGKIYVEEGKKIFRSTEYGDDKDRVVVRDDGRPTYLLADIAYHKNKIERGYDRIYDIWGPDHHGYIARLAGAVQSIGYPKENFKVIIAQQVNLLESGQKVKMSKRAGSFQTMSDLIGFLGKHGKDVGRYFFVMRSLDAPLDFDLDLAKDESDKNPVFYLQYAHARICSIFREVGDETSKEAASKLEMSDERKRLLFWIARFPEEILDSAIAMEPHRVTNYLQSFAKTFTTFYLGKNNRLKEASEETKLGLARICLAAKDVLAQGLGLIGVSAPEKMEKEI
ncbi:arginine--tRNA ligase [Leptospira gomenensis]|uniref:Arginine--tRNA ligase n=1 Tax=Leptospira gomenensis TaxID=2484974 RepID=A0A5F1YRS5_9LEPT|nr:arginine--tRNA ligase [Leptospira gomenensis]TGK30885.1 arginine--tRNA ligase [Leptospira gomenensis]TGK32523.1 arginine--tRNA ligase [Leptospira gomenensis]TGK45395.1 arginine--tRNA ligase [Leptospira gomenensis]TGK60613.1 arginine--tRNA ligase [Leptospira gomenensis]